MAQQPLNLSRSGLGMLPADAQARHLAGQFMKAKRSTDSLLAQEATPYKLLGQGYRSPW